MTQKETEEAMYRALKRRSEDLTPAWMFYLVYIAIAIGSALIIWSIFNTPSPGHG